MAVRIKKGSDMQQLPVVPLVDTLLNLLIFFLVTTKFAEVERSMEAALADADAARPVSAALDALYIDIDAEGFYYTTGNVQPVSTSDLYRVLKTAWVNNPRVSATIRADKRCRWQSVVNAMNVCKKAKVRFDIAAQDTRAGSG
jgi:biopolymer transport protein ExbD